jgi:hypothetical protein
LQKCNSCLRLHFTLFINVLNVPGDGGLIALKEFCGLRGGEPDRLADAADVDAGLADLGLKKMSSPGSVMAEGILPPQTVLGSTWN